MPDFDSGHIFLTTLAPIKSANNDDIARLSYQQNVRVELAKLPTALQSPATIKTGVNSPFSKNNRTHLARMFVLDDAVYNGKVGKNPLAAILRHSGAKKLQNADKLNTPYLVFCAEIDAISADGEPLPKTLTPEAQKDVRANYARELWQTMEFQLQDIYRNCVGFENIDTADQFADYLEACHVETTMPFHDYYLEMPEFNHLPVYPLGAAVAIPAVIALLSLLGWLFGMLTLPLLGWSSFWTFVIASLVTALVVVLAIMFANKNGEKPLAPGKYDDLPSVLKALYCQQNFSDFIVENQGVSAEKLHKDFGAFLEKHKPSNVQQPSQPPGVLRASDEATS